MTTTRRFLWLMTAMAFGAGGLPQVSHASCTGTLKIELSCDDRPRPIPPKPPQPHPQPTPKPQPMPKPAPRR